MRVCRARRRKVESIKETAGWIVKTYTAILHL
jgi:hypothetical protein